MWLIRRDYGSIRRIFWGGGTTIHRLDGEAIRDSLLAISGDLELSIGGPYVPTTRIGTAEVVVEDGHTGAARRSLFYNIDEVRA